MRKRPVFFTYGPNTPPEVVRQLQHEAMRPLEIPMGGWYSGLIGMVRLVMRWREPTEETFWDRWKASGRAYSGNWLGGRFKVTSRPSLDSYRDFNDR